MSACQQPGPARSASPAAANGGSIMKAALIIFDDMTCLDFIGFYDPLTRLKSMDILPDFEWRLCARKPHVTDDRGLRIPADSANESLGGCDLLFVPGGFGTRKLQHDGEFMEWLKTASTASLKVSVCTGSVLLGAAGYLRGLQATSHPNALDELRPYCDRVVRQRIVDEGAVITAGGVTSAIDLGLHVVQRLAGIDARMRIARQMDYPCG
jgi:transcriptional regulator GlxA family with amidase domain